MLDDIHHVRMKKRTRTIRVYFNPKGEWYILPSLHYERWGDPLHITFNFLCFTLAYHSVIRYTVEEFKQLLKDMKIKKFEPGFFELSKDDNQSME